MTTNKSESASTETIDFFISHAGHDRRWAEWIAWHLLDAGYTIELDTWDWSVGQNLFARMDGALTVADRVLAVFSNAYFEEDRHTNEVAVDLHALGQIEEARRRHETLLTRARDLLGDDHPDTIDCARALARDLHVLGMTGPARELTEDALNRLAQDLGDDCHYTIAAANEHVENLHATGAHAEADTLAADTLQRAERVLGQWPSPHTDGRAQPAVSLAAAGRFALGTGSSEAEA